MEATHLLQQKKPGYYALWNHILQVSMADLKKNYENLQVTFDLWKKESDAQPYIPEMVEYLKEKGYAYESEGALVVDADLETEIPCNLLDTLPDCYSSVLKLRVFGFTPTEIAELQDINILTVYKRIARGKKMILEKIRKERL